jgi:hypothetical protein
MQHAVTRWCGALALVLPVLAPAAPAGTDARTVQGVDERASLSADSRTAARSLFRPENAVGARSPVPGAVGGMPLDDQRGGADTHNAMRLDGVVDTNTAVNVVSGANSIDSGSFANMAGLPVVIQNSGANVLIQNATIINLQFK